MPASQGKPLAVSAHDVGSPSPMEIVVVEVVLVVVVVAAKHMPVKHIPEGISLVAQLRPF